MPFQCHENVVHGSVADRAPTGQHHDSNAEPNDHDAQGQDRHKRRLVLESFGQSHADCSDKDDGHTEELCVASPCVDRGHVVHLSAAPTLAVTGASLRAYRAPPCWGCSFPIHL